MFPCEQCAACCRQVGNSELGKRLALPSGICKYLNQKTNLCTRYAKRPIFCNVDAYYDKYLTQVISREKFYQMNKEQCRHLRKLEGVD